MLDLVKRLGEQGLAVVLVSHNLTDVFEVADRITVLRLGRNVGVYEKAGTTQQRSSRRSPRALQAAGQRHEHRRRAESRRRRRPGRASARSRAAGGRPSRPATSASCPVIVGMIAISVFFTAKTNIFFTAVNFST